MIRAVALLVAVLGYLTMCGQQYPVRVFLQDQVSGQQVNAIAQGADGQLWLGLSEGLASFDGWDMHQHILDRHGAITALFPSPDGYIWLGTAQGGVGRLQGDAVIWTDSTGNAPRSRIIYLAMVGDSLLAVTETAGLYCYANSQWTYLEVQGYQPGLSVYAAILSPEEQLWLAGDQGIFFYDVSSGSVRLYTMADGLPDIICTALSLSAGGTLWIGTFDSGIASFDDQADRFVRVMDKPWQAGEVTALRELTDGTVWITTARAGLVEWHPSLPDTVTSVVGLSPVSLRKTKWLLTDREGSVWTVSDNALINLRPCVAVIHEPAGEMAGEILAVHVGQDGIVYLSTPSGVYATTSGRHKDWRKMAIAGLTDKDMVVAIQQDGAGNLWLGTFGQGLLRVMPSGRADRFTELDGLVNDNVLDLAIYGDTLWMATLGGVGCVPLPESGKQAGYRFINYTTEDGLGTNYVYQVYPDSKGRIWFATDGKGLSLLEKGRFRQFGKQHGLSSEVVYSITEDQNGIIWFSALHAGIYSFDGTTFRQFTRKEGLHGVDVVALSATDGGHLVIVHEEGVDLLDTRSLQLIHLEDEIGLPRTNANLNVLDKSRSGDVWVGMQNGLLRYRIAGAKQAFAPQLSIRGLLIDRRPAPLSRSMRLTYRQNHLTFLYTGIWFSSPEMVLYQHRLEGFDTTWVTTRDRQVSYPGLPPGEYTFSVRCSIDGVFDSEQPVSVSFVVQRPFWQTWWFVSLLVIVLAASLYLYIRLRERRIRQWQQLERDKIEFQFQTLRSQISPHFLFNSFNTLLTMIEDDKEQAAAYVQTMSDFFRDILSYRDVDLIPLSDELEVLQRYFALQQQRFGNNLQLRVDLPDLEHAMIPPLTLQLLVENAIKHNVVSKAKPLTVEITSEGDRLIVRNNLQLKQETEVSTRVGLSNIAKRYQLLSSEPVLLEADDHYFTVRLPIIIRST